MCRFCAVYACEPWASAECVKNSNAMIHILLFLGEHQSFSKGCSIWFARSETGEPDSGFCVSDGLKHVSKVIFNL